jgi:hypothetical protein
MRIEALEPLDSPQIGTFKFMWVSFRVEVYDVNHRDIARREGRKAFRAAMDDARGALVEDVADDIMAIFEAHGGERRTPHHLHRTLERDVSAKVGP